jgi:hypothetical protein
MRSVLLACLLPFLSHSQNLLDINEAIRLGRVAFTTTPLESGQINNAFDANPATLLRSANVNPMVVNLEFLEPIPVIGMRLLASGGAGAWTVESADSTFDLNSQTGSYVVHASLRPLADGLWDSLTLARAARLWRLTLRKIGGDNFVQLNEWEISSSLAPSSVTINTIQSELYPSWRKQLSIRGNSTVPLRITGGTWNTLTPTIATVDSNGVIRALEPGSAVILASAAGLNASLTIPVRAPALAPEIVANPPVLAQPAPNSLYEIPVLILRYLPTRDGVGIDTTYDSDLSAPGEISVAQMKLNLETNDRRLKFMFEEGSRFRGYKAPLARPAVGYKVVAAINVYEPVPPGRANAQSPTRFYPDYEAIFERFNVRQYIEQQGVKEIWFWGGTAPETTASPDRLRAYWESEMSGPNGRVCNCGEPSGLPAYPKTYVLFGRSTRQTQAEAARARGHHLEKILTQVNNRDADTALFTTRFLGFDATGTFQRGRCGSANIPPNTVTNYDYLNETPFAGDCEDWIPDGGGATKPISATTWASIPYAWPDPSIPLKTESQFYIYWMQGMPGIASAIPHRGQQMSNWWQFTADWDASTTAGLGLMEVQATPAVAPPPASLPGTAGRFTVPVTAPGNYSWIVVPNESWIRPSVTSGRGSAQVEINLDANTGAAREGSIVIAGQRLIIRQEGAAIVTIKSYALAQVALGGNPAAAQGGRWSTFLYFTNTTTNTASISVDFIKNDGTPWPVQTPGGVATVATLSLLPGATTVLPLTGGGTLEQGWAAPKLPVGVFGNAVLRQTITNREDQEAVVPLSDDSKSSYTLVWDDAGFSSAVAVANTSTVAASIQVIVRDAGGTPIGAGIVNLGPKQKTAFVIRTQLNLPQMAGNRGAVDIKAVTGTIAVLGLRFANVAFTSVPPNAP